MQIHYVQIGGKTGADVKLNQKRDDYNYDISNDSGNKKGCSLYSIGYKMKICCY